MHMTTIEYRIINTAAAHVFSERFLSAADAHARILEYRDRGEMVDYLAVVTISAPKFHWLEGEDTRG